MDRRTARSRPMGSGQGRCGVQRVIYPGAGLANARVHSRAKLRKLKPSLGNPLALPGVLPADRMPAFMRSLIVVALLAAGCGDEIGDACIISSDCSPNADRTCDTSSQEGYCTIQGCDYSTCPEEAACIRFFTGSFSNLTCDPVTEDSGTDDCMMPRSFCGPCAWPNAAT